MEYESTGATGDTNPGGIDLRETRASMIEKTREAWITRPEELLPLDAKIAVGVGFAALTRGGWVIFEENDHAGTRAMTVAEAEKLAQRAPEYEWCIHLVGPGRERHYKRVGEAQWKLYRWGAGLGRPETQSLPRRRKPREALQDARSASSSHRN